MQLLLINRVVLALLCGVLVQMMKIRLHGERMETYAKQRVAPQGQSEVLAGLLL